MRRARGAAVAVLAILLLGILLVGGAPAAPVAITVPYATTAVADADLDGNPATGAWTDALSATIPLENGAASPYGSAILYAKHDGTYVYFRLDGKIDVLWASATGNHFWVGLQLTPAGTSHHGGGTWDGVFFGLWDGTDYAPQPTYPPMAVDTNDFGKPPLKDTAQDDLGKMASSGSSAPYSFTAEWKRKLSTGDSSDIVFTADGTTTYNFFATTDSNGRGSSGGGVDHSVVTNLNTMRFAAPPAPTVHDVAVTTASASPTNVLQGAPVTVSATVQNQGTVSESFDVKGYAGAILIGTKSVAALSAGASQSLSYSWDTTAATPGSYTIKVEAVAVAGETDTADNTYTDGSVTVNPVVHDVAITAASASPTSGLVGIPVTISATAANQGTQAETFDVKAYAGSILVGTQTVSALAAGATKGLTFNWDTSTVAANSYQIKVEAVALAGETDLADNVYTDGTVTLSAVVHDVAITTASASPLSGTVGVLVSISATAANQGTQAETFDVKAYAGSILVGTQAVTGLASGGSKSLSFSWNTAGVAPNSYPIRVEAAAVAGESDTADNSYSDGTVVLSAVVVHDVAVTTASANPTSGLPGMLVTITATVQNQGTQAETFDVKAYAGAIVVGTKAVSALASGASQGVDFTWDTTGVAPGSYQVKVEAVAVAGETDLADNIFTDGSVIVSQVVHDVAVTTASASPISGLVGISVSIAATVANQGTQAETFDVKAYAGTILVGTQAVSALAAGATKALTFTWDTSTASPGSFVIRVEASTVAGESDTTDNVYSDGTVVLSAVVHDVGITAASTNPLSGTVGTLVTVTTTAKNFGTQAETFDVTAYAGTVSIGTRTVSGLAAGATQALTFSWDTTGATAGSYEIRVEAAAVAGETDLTNNAYVDGTVVLSPVVHDVAVLDASVSPTSGVIGDTFVVTVIVVNQGTQSETFDVSALANDLVIGTKAVTLAAGATGTLTFSWSTAGVNAGTYAISAKAAAVPGETDLGDNAFQDGSVALATPPPASPVLKLGRIWPDWRRTYTGGPQVFYAKVVNTATVGAWARVTYDIYDRPTGQKLATVLSNDVWVPAGATRGDTTFASDLWTGGPGIYTAIGTLTYGTDPANLNLVDGTKQISRFVIL